MAEAHPHWAGQSASLSARWTRETAPRLPASVWSQRRHPPGRPPPCAMRASVWRHPTNPVGALMLNSGLAAHTPAGWGLPREACHTLLTPRAPAAPQCDTGATLGKSTGKIRLPGGSDGEKSACNAGDVGLIPGRGDPLEKGMATHSRTLAWRSPRETNSAMTAYGERCWIRDLQRGFSSGTRDQA